MFINSDPNSGLEQCTESKLGRMHRVHTLNPGCAHTMRALCPGLVHAASWAPCCGTHWRCVVALLRLCLALCRGPCRKPPGHDTEIISRLNSCCVARATARVSWFLCHVVGRCCVVSQPLACCVATSSLPLFSRYNHLYHDTPQQPHHARGRARAPLAPCTGRPCRGASWLYRRVVSQPYHAVSWCATTHPYVPS